MDVWNLKVDRRASLRFLTWRGDANEKPHASAVKECHFGAERQTEMADRGCLDRRRHFCRNRLPESEVVRPSHSRGSFQTPWASWLSARLERMFRRALRIRRL